MVTGYELCAHPRPPCPCRQRSSIRPNCSSTPSHAMRSMGWIRSKREQVSETKWASISKGLVVPPLWFWGNPLTDSTAFPVGCLTRLAR
jgi:hypothetical protein